MLKTLLMVTVLVSDPELAVQAYSESLDYRVVSEGVIGQQLADGWAAAQIADNGFHLLQPASGEPVYLRFVHSADQANYRPLRTAGWNAIEILVQNTDALAERLQRHGHFRIVGPPAWLTDKQRIRAMQVIGPSNELVYLTRIGSSESSGFGLLPARSYVDRVFIMVLGAAQREPLDSFYRDQLGMPVAGPYPYRVSVLSKAYGLDPATTYPLTLVQLSRRFLLELDDYPDAVEPRRKTSEGLPGGIAMVTFTVADLDALALAWLAPPRAIQAPPYAGRRAATLVGPAGEYIELVEEDLPQP